MLSFERLKELKAEFEQVRKCNDRHCMSTVTEDDVLEVLDEAIARQSVTSEDVAEAIELFEGAIKYRKDQEEEVKKHYGGKLPDFYLDLNRKEALAIAALQAYQPTTRKDRTVEEVAISKTETTSARALSCWYCTEMEKHGVVAVKTVLDKAGRELDAYETPYNFCPNCGRKLD